MKNVILTDSMPETLQDLKEGLEESTKENWEIKSYISNWGRTSIWKKVKRMLVYFFAPFKVFINRKKYKKIVGWQQFYTLIYCFYCRIFHVKKVNKVYVVNFTYKKKNGVAGKIYYKFMSFILKSKYIDYLFVPSVNYISECAKEFNIDESKFKTLPFGIPDLYDLYKDKKMSENFILSIGRSNRDYDWLIKQWQDINYPLYIICDTYKSNINIPQNVTIIDNISGEKQYPYIINCKALILPIKIDNICSGDTVLLTAMSFEKNVIVTKGSTLSEMYLEEGKNGFIVDKNNNELKIIVEKILSNKINLGKAARNKFMNNYSRYQMGINIGKIVNN